MLLLVQILPFLATAQTNGSIAVGSTLTASAESSFWLSPSGDFAFGFHQLEDKAYFLLAIWYDKIPEKTMVWYANGDRPAPTGSIVRLIADRGLVLNDPQGNEIWNSNIIPGSVSNGFMNDTGNFVLESSTSEMLWQSFSNPTDTLLPNQIMEPDGQLSSSRSETNYSKGRFQLRLLEDGNLVLNSVNLATFFAYDAYYISGTNDQQNSSNSGYRFMFNESGYLYILRRNGQTFVLSRGRAVPTTDFYQRATLNFDGVFTQYLYPKSSSAANRSWSPIWSIPENICVNMEGPLGSGACGFNSICSLNQYQRPVCNCPQNFSLLDANDKYGACIPDFVLSCRADEQNSTEDMYDLYEMNNVAWPTSNYERYYPYGEVECGRACLNDCLCAVAVHRDGGCWKKKLPLSNGRIDSRLNSKAFIKIQKGYRPQENPNLQNHERKKKPDSMIITGSVLLASSALLNLIFVAFFVRFPYIYRKKVEVQPREQPLETNLCSFTYNEIVEATDNFTDELGRGAVGVVYKGVLRKSSTVHVAVKKLDRMSKDSDKEFKTEVQVIGQTHHKNLVKLIGFCEEGQHRLLVYEFLSNGTLADFIFRKPKSDWNQRIQIAIGVARGILYLHEECATQIIHCDIKPQNILLDEYYNARISDFGLAKLLLIGQSRTLTSIKGTKGYVAPEWFRNVPVAAKVDVYSFGVVLLEIICCRKNVMVTSTGGEGDILTYWAYECYINGTLRALIEDDMEAMNDIWWVEKLVKVAIWCIQEDPSARPTMKKVTQMLEGVVDVPEPPNPSPFSITT